MGSSLSLPMVPNKLQHTVDDRDDTDAAGDGEDSYSTYQDTNACYEIKIENDGDAGAAKVRTVTNAVNSPADAVDDDGDKMFGMLIAEELRKMTPAAQKDFKRSVTRLLYT